MPFILTGIASSSATTTAYVTSSSASMPTSTTTSEQASSGTVSEVAPSEMSSSEVMQSASSSLSETSTTSQTTSSVKDITATMQTTRSSSALPTEPPHLKPIDITADSLVSATDSGAHLITRSWILVGGICTNWLARDSSPRGAAWSAIFCHAYEVLSLTHRISATFTTLERFKHSLRPMSLGISYATQRSDHLEFRVVQSGSSCIMYKVSAKDVGVKERKSRLIQR